MKVTELTKHPNGTLYQLERPQIFRSDCISSDDSEVNSKNALDVLESCKSNEYSYLLKTPAGKFDLYFPCSANGTLLHDLPIMSYPAGKTIEAMMKLYGNDTMLYYHVEEQAHQVCDYENWHPDHKI